MALGSYASSQLNVTGERPSTPSLFNFQPKQQEEDRTITSAEAKQLFTGKSSQDRKMIYDKLKSNGFVFEDEVTTTQPIVKSPQSSGFGQGVADVTAGIASGASQAVGGTLGIIGDFLSAPFSEDVSIGGIFTGKNKG